MPANEVGKFISLLKITVTCYNLKFQNKLHHLIKTANFADYTDKTNLN
jgi:hypothetical protein